MHIYIFFFLPHVQVIEEPMRRTLEALRKKCVTAIVGGSDFVKIEEQMAGKGLLLLLLE